MKRLGKVWTVIVYLFLYLPMIVLFVGSFNDGRNLSEFEGFTLSNYVTLFRDTDSLALLLNSVILAVSSALLATLIGTFAAVGIHSMRGRIRSLVMTVTNIPLVEPGDCHRCQPLSALCLRGAGPTAHGKRPRLYHAADSARHI